MHTNDLAIADHHAADALHSACVAPTAVRFGDKVFLSTLGIVPQDHARVLAALHRDGLIVLVRCDLVSAVDPAMVAASELTVPGPRGLAAATWHCIELPR